MIDDIDYDEYLKRFYIKTKGNLYELFKNETRVLDDSATDTNKKLKKRLDLLEKYYEEIKVQKSFDEEEYQNVIEYLRKIIKDAETQN